MPYTKRKHARKYSRSTRKNASRRKKNHKKAFRPRKMNNTIQYNLMNTEASREYFTPLTSKTDSLSSTIQRGSGLTNESTLSQMLASYVSNLTFKANFRYWRCPRVIIKLIPEMWNASTPTTTGSDGEKPTIHYIIDQGQTQTYIDPAFAPTTTTLTIPNASAYGKFIYKTKQFTKPVTLSFAPMRYRLDDKTYSYNKWLPCNSTTPNSQLEGCFNTFYGFSNLVTGFKYKTEITFVLLFKDPVSTA